MIAGENTNAASEAFVEVAGDQGFGIGSVIKVSIKARGDTVMVCDAAVCGSASWGGSVSGNGLSSTEVFYSDL